MKNRAGSLGFPGLAGSVIRAFPSEQQGCAPLCTLPHCPAPPDIAARTLTAPELSITELRGVYPQGSLGTGTTGCSVRAGSQQGLAGCYWKEVSELGEHE